MNRGSATRRFSPPRGFKQWRVKKVIRSNVYHNKVRQHFLNLLILKQGLRYYYGGFRLFFLKTLPQGSRKEAGSGMRLNVVTPIERCHSFQNLNPILQKNFLSFPNRV